MTIQITLRLQQSSVRQHI